MLHFFCCLLTWGSNGDTTRCRSLINVDLNSNSRSNPVKCGHRVTCCCWVLDALFKSGLLQSGSNVSTSGLRYAAHHHGNKRPSEFMSLSQRTDLTTTFLPVTVRLCRIYTGVLGYFFPHHSETGVTFKKSAGKISYWSAEGEFSLRLRLTQILPQSMLRWTQTVSKIQDRHLPQKRDQGRQKDSEEHFGPHSSSGSLCSNHFTGESLINTVSPYYRANYIQRAEEKKS